MKNLVKKKPVVLFLGILICSLMLILLIIQYSQEFDSASSPEPQVGEIVKRDRQTYTKFVGVTKEGAKQYAVTSDLSPIHYLDKNGEWQEYNFNLKKSAEDGYAYELTASDYQVYFKESLTDSPAVRIERDDRYMNMHPAELQYSNKKGESHVISEVRPDARASVAGNVITYKNAYGQGIDLMFTVSTAGVTKEVIIHSFDTLPLPLVPDPFLEVNIEFANSPEISVHASEVLEDEEKQIWNGATIHPKGTIQFKDTNPNAIDRNYDNRVDETDTIVFESVPAVARDSAEEPAYIDSDTGSLTLVLHNSDGANITSVRTPYSWLENAVYPVYIDPSIGPRNPSSATSTSGSFSWSSPTNIYTSNNADASVGFAAFQTGTTQYLMGYNLGFNVPSNAIIQGYYIEAEMAGSTGSSISNIAIFNRGQSTSTPVATKTLDTALTSSDTYYSAGDDDDNWGLGSTHLTPSFVNSGNFGIAVNATMTGFSFSSRSITCDHIRVTVYYSIPPEITVSPSVNYGSFTRLGPSNTPVTVSFTATDDETTGSNQLTYQIRTASGGGGTLVGSGNATSGQNKVHNITNTASGLIDGSQTLYLRVSDGSLWSNDASFTLLRDTSESATSDPTHSPNLVTSAKQYTVSFTPSDAYSTGSNELSYQIRTASGGGGSLLTSGNATSGNQVTTGTITDSALIHGRKENWRYLRITDGAGNVHEKSFQVAVDIPFPTPTPRPTGSFEGFSAEGIQAEGIRFD